MKKSDKLWQEEQEQAQEKVEKELEKAKYAIGRAFRACQHLGHHHDVFEKLHWAIYNWAVERLDDFQSLCSSDCDPPNYREEKKKRTPKRKSK